jgi:hypothetical protein
MGGKPDTSGADEANKLAAQEAKRAREKEIERQKRLDTGYSNIRNIFEGAPVNEKKGVSTGRTSTHRRRRQAVRRAGRL